jgi:PAS domain S-box-containing protein
VNGRTTVSPAPGAYHIFNELDASILILSTDLRVDWVNAGMQSLLDAEWRDMCGLGAPQFFTRFVLPRTDGSVSAEEILEPLISHPESFNLTFTLRNGHDTLLVNCSGRLLKREPFHGCWLITFREIDRTQGPAPDSRPREMQRPHFASDRRESFYLALFETSPTGAVIYRAVNGGSGFVVRNLNPAAEALLDVRREDVLHRDLADVMPIEECRRFVDLLRKVRTHGGTGECATTLAREGCRALCLKHSVHRLPSGDIADSIEDMSPQRLLDTSMAGGAKKFRGIASHSSDAIFTCDCSGTITYISPAAQRIAGYAPSEMIGRHGYEYLGCGGEGRYYEHLRTLLEGKDVEGRITELVRRDGSRVNVEISASPIIDAGTVIGIQGVVRDITDRLQAEEVRKRAVDQINHNIEQFAVLGDHIRQPLQVILGMTDLIEDERTDVIVQQVRRINNVIQQLDQGWIESRKIRAYLRRHE